MILQKLCSIVVSVALVVGPESIALAQVSPDADFSHPPVLSGSQQVSPAVLRNVTNAVHQYALKKQAGRLTKSDVEVAAAAMKTAFDHLQEIGFNSALEKKFLDNPEAFANFHLSDTALQSFQKTLEANGIHSSASHLRDTLDPQYSDRQEFLTAVKNQGLYKTELQMVEQFKAHELEFVSASSSGKANMTLASQQSKSGGAQLLRVRTWYEYAACIVAAAVGLGSACTWTVFACEAAVLLCGACALGCE